MSIPSAVLLEGIIVGLNYGLLALGLVLVYRTNRVLNFAQGQLGVVGAVFLLKCDHDWGFNYWFAFTLAIIMATATAAGSELILRRLFKFSRVVVMIATTGLAALLYTFTALPFIRPSTFQLPYPLPFKLSFHIGTATITPASVLILIVAPVVGLGVIAFVKFSPWGMAMRAMSENVDSARLSGVWVRRTSTLTWALAGMLAGFTEILALPAQQRALSQPLTPQLLIFALIAALVGAMTNLTMAFVAGIGVGVVYEVLTWNITSVAAVQTIMFALLLVVFILRVASLRKGVRVTDRSSWFHGSAHRAVVDRLRRRVGTGGVLLTIGVAALLPVVLDVGTVNLFSTVCVYAMIALSTTVIVGWAGQVSLGQFGLVAVGVVMATHLAGHVPLPLLLVFVGAVTAVVSIIVGLPALRVRGLYLAVSTLGFALWMYSSVVTTSCWTLPVLHKRLCTGFPTSASSVVSRPSLFGLSLSSTRNFAWFALGVLVLTAMMVMVWRDRGVARRLIAVRDNEFTAAAMGIPVVRTKLLGFALSGFIAGYAGVCLALTVQRVSTTLVAPTLSILAVAMVVIGGLGTVPGAILGAIYLVGLRVLFGTAPTVELITGGFGVLIILLFLPGGLTSVVEKIGDVCTLGVRKLVGGRPPEAGQIESRRDPDPVTLEA